MTTDHAHVPDGDDVPDDLIPITEAARLMPSCRAGKKCHPFTILRWIRTGRLQGYRNGSWWYVSKKALRGLLRPVDITPPVMPATARARARQAAWTNKILRDAGIAR